MALRRQVKNVVKNFSDIEVKVREATSNDPWGPSSSLTSEIADATYNVQAFSELMTLLWKRLNDHGKNWRHVYKSLVVLDYIVKTGSERVAQQCRENIFAIKTLKDFQFIDKDGKDQGINVREKSKQLVALLKDDERLKAERQRALKAKERFTQAQGGIGNTSFPKNKKFQATGKYREARGSVDDSNLPSSNWTEAADKPADSQSTDGRIDSDMEKVRPSNEIEEEMQLQIALAMSREEAEKSEKDQHADSQLMNMVSNQSKQDQQPSTLLNLTDQSSNAMQPSSFDPWGQPAGPALTQPPPVQPVADPWGNNVAPQNVLTSHTTNPMVPNDPWDSHPVAAAPVAAADPWSTPAPKQDPWNDQESLPVQPPRDPFAPIAPQASSLAADPFASQVQPEMQNLSLFDTSSDPANFEAGKKSSFLSNGAHLVDVDNILAPQQSSTTRVANPFMTSPSSSNPFLQDKPKAKSINEIRSEKGNVFAAPGPDNGTLLPTPLQPNNKSANNPFL